MQRISSTANPNPQDHQQTMRMITPMPNVADSPLGGASSNPFNIVSCSMNTQSYPMHRTGHAVILQDATNMDTFRQDDINSVNTIISQDNQETNVNLVPNVTAPSLGGATGILGTLLPHLLILILILRRILAILFICRNRA